MIKRKNDEINNFEDDCGLDDKSLSENNEIDVNKVDDSKEDNNNNQDQEKELSISEKIFGIAFLLLIMPFLLTSKHSSGPIIPNKIISIMWTIAIVLLLFDWIFLKDKNSKGCLKYLLIFTVIVFAGGYSVYLLISSIVDFLNG